MGHPSPPRLLTAIHCKVSLERSSLDTIGQAASERSQALILKNVLEINWYTRSLNDLACVVKDEHRLEQCGQKRQVLHGASLKGAAPSRLPHRIILPNLCALRSLFFWLKQNSAAILRNGSQKHA